MSHVQARQAPTHDTPYDKSYYQRQESSSIRSANAAVPVILEFVQPRSVVDIGCGVGTWLSVFRQHGIDDLLGVDGPYVNPAQLRIQGDQFKGHNLAQALRLDRSFDLAISLEVAEHLPACAAETFVDTLARLSKVIVFSAAAPFQGGTRHVNEQLPEYWARLFAAKGYVAVDALRHRLWKNAGVTWFYAQNMLFYVAQDALDEHPALRRAYESTDQNQLNIIHPDIFANMSLRSAGSLFLRILGKSLRKQRRRARLAR